jgi:hypothetical protein
MAAGDDRAQSQADYHQAFWGEVQPKEGRLLTPAKAINHTDEELEYWPAWSTSAPPGRLPAKRA